MAVQGLGFDVGDYPFGSAGRWAGPPSAGCWMAVYWAVILAGGLARGEAGAGVHHGRAGDIAQLRLQKGDGLAHLLTTRPSPNNGPALAGAR